MALEPRKHQSSIMALVGALGAVPYDTGLCFIRRLKSTDRRTKKWLVFHLEVFLIVSWTLDCFPSFRVLHAAGIFVFISELLFFKRLLRGTQARVMCRFSWLVPVFIHFENVCVLRSTWRFFKLNLVPFCFMQPFHEVVFFLRIFVFNSSCPMSKIRCCLSKNLLFFRRFGSVHSFLFLKC